MSHMKKILVVGDVMLDTWVTVNPHKISQEAPVMVVKHAKTTYTLGGAGNVAVNCAHLGAEVTLMGIRGVGQRDNLDDCCNRNNINNLMTTGDDWTTIEKCRFVDGSGQHLLRMDTEESSPILDDELYSRFERLLVQELHAADVVVVSDYCKGTIDPRIAMTLKTAHRSREFFMIVNAKPGTVDWYPTTNVLTLNTHEAMEYAVKRRGPSPSTNVVQNARLAGIANEHLVVTAGEDGMEWSNVWNGKNERIHIPAHKVQVADVTGAGDTIVATIAAYGRIDEVVLKAAAKNAASVVSQRGTSVPTK